MPSLGGFIANGGGNLPEITAVVQHIPALIIKNKRTILTLMQYQDAAAEQS